MAGYPIKCFITISILAILTQSLARASTRNLQDVEVFIQSENETKPVIGLMDVKDLLCPPEKCPSALDTTMCVPCPPIIF